MCRVRKYCDWMNFVLAYNFLEIESVCGKKLENCFVDEGKCKTPVTAIGSKNVSIP